MKTKFMVAIFACLSFAAYAALPKVAVLDAVLPEKMDKDVAIGITEKISEELVGSGKYTVLDRTTVGQSLKEIEFQMSGLVSDADLKKAGEQLNSRLGATYVVVARVSLVGGTYFVSAKMVDIKTGEITAQASDQEEGGVAVTLTIAQTVGRKLAGGVKEAATTTPAVEPQQGTTTPVAAPQAGAKALHSSISASYMFPVLSGSAVTTMETYTLSSDTFSAGGWNVHWLQFLFSGLYLSASISGTDTSITYGSTTDGFYSTLDFLAGVGWGFPLGSNLQMYAGVQVGYLELALGTFWVRSGDTQGDLAYGAEVGFDWVLFNFLSLETRLSYTGAALTSGAVFTNTEDINYIGLAVGVGIAY